MDLNLEDFAQRVNAELVGKLVNIASRCAGFVQQHFDGRLPGLNLDTEISYLAAAKRLDLACRPEWSMVSHSVVCSIRPFEATGRHRSTSAPTTIRCIDLAMASQSANPGGSRNQDGALCSPVSSVRGAADRDGSKGVFGSHVILDDR